MALLDHGNNAFGYLSYSDAALLSTLARGEQYSLHANPKFF